MRKLQYINIDEDEDEDELINCLLETSMTYLFIQFFKYNANEQRVKT